MKLKDLKALLDTLNIPVAYDHFNKPVNPPFIAYLVDNHNSNLMADDKVYKKVNSVFIELYTEIKDEQLEEQLEQLLEDNGFPWISSCYYIQDENLYETIYEINLI